jgi:peptidyl-prolyl cis-trans isomerase A (cyclophilin A)
MTATVTLALVLNLGTVKIALNPDLAPKHVKQITTLVHDKAYDGITFHRVIDGFVAQVGDVKHGHYESLDPLRVGSGASDLPNIPAEFTDTPHLRGTVSMARSNHPDSANSQFFICLADARFLDNQYTVFGHVTEGMDIIDQIKKGTDSSGSVGQPDYIINAYIES